MTGTTQHERENSGAADWAGALDRAREHSAFLTGALDRLPEIAGLLAASRGEDALAAAHELGTGEGEIGALLRRERLGMALALGIGDLAGAFTLGRVMTELSDLADSALDRAITASITKRVPDAVPAGMTALALGKQGARELNYSSDIDPILLFDPEILPRRPRDEPGEAAQRYAREIVQTLSQNTAEGYVFRVDLRLRPASEVSPLALTFNAALSHYESSALAWERAAYIRARSAGGDIAAGEAFLAAIQPFVWRSSLDFGAIDDIRRLTARIRSSHDGPQMPGPGFDVKLGRGGIREIEFYAQTHQLIHGGRDPALRRKGTRAALDALAQAGHIPVDAAQQLGPHYDRLRTIEHRLQMVADHQTHTIPQTDAATDNVARLDGLENGAALLSELTRITAEVAARFDSLIDDAAPGAAPVPVKLSRQMSQLGFAEPKRMAKRVERWSDGRYRSLRSDAAIQAFDVITPPLLHALARAPDPGAALARFETLLERLPSAINLFRLLEARPGLLRQMIDVLTLAPPLADEMARRPELLDQLIDQSAMDLPGDTDILAQAMRRGVSPADYEARLDRIRVVTGETRFALGVQLIGGVHDPLDIAAALSRTAQASLEVAAAAAAEEFARAHGRIAGGELVVLGLGRLGGGMLTHASDLDIIYLFTGDIGTQSDGPRPLGSTRYFNRLAQRVTAALSVPTAQGALYEVDTRLRPQGAQGPLCVSVDSFAKYQQESAWTWEHMALSRARPLVGSPDARAQIDAVIRETLCSARDNVALRTAVLDMRAEMALHKPAQGPLDAKLSRGGLVDLEFLVHFVQLSRGQGLSPDLHDAIDMLAQNDLVPAELAGAYQVLTRLLVAARLLAPDQHEPADAAREALAQACRAPSYAALLEEFADARRRVARSWDTILNTKLEIS